MYALLLFVSGLFVAGYPLSVTLWYFAGFAGVLLCCTILFEWFVRFRPIAPESH